MFIRGLTDSGALPTLERAVQFAARRQTLIQHNIANVSTPNFEPVDVSVPAFREALGEAIDERREKFGGHRGELALRGTREIGVPEHGSLELRPRPSGHNILFHDRNNRDVERLMQDLAENVAAFRVASDLFRTRMDLINAAIRERP